MACIQLYGTYEIHWLTTSLVDLNFLKSNMQAKLGKMRLIQKQWTLVLFFVRLCTSNGKPCLTDELWLKWQTNKYAWINAFVLSLVDLFMLIIFIIIPCNLFFLFISRKPISWPANNCHQIMVCLCAMSSTCVWPQKIFSVLRWFLSEKRQIALLSEDIHKKQTNKQTNLVIEW